MATTSGKCNLTPRAFDITAGGDARAHHFEGDTVVEVVRLSWRDEHLFFSITLD